MLVAALGRNEIVDHTMRMRSDSTMMRLEHNPSMRCCWWPNRTLLTVFWNVSRLSTWVFLYVSRQQRLGRKGAGLPV